MVNTTTVMILIIQPVKPLKTKQMLMEMDMLNVTMMEVSGKVRNLQLDILIVKIL